MFSFQSVSSPWAVSSIPILFFALLKLNQIIFPTFTFLVGLQIQHIWNWTHDLPQSGKFSAIFWNICPVFSPVAAAAAKSLQLYPTLWPHRQQPTRPLCPWDSPGKNTGVGCHFLLQCMKVKSESEVAQSCLTVSDPMDYSLPGSSIHGICQARVLEWGVIAFSIILTSLFIF